jgi:hypothetical protein
MSGGVQHVAHGQQRRHKQDTGHMNEVGHNQHKGYLQKQQHMPHTGHMNEMGHHQHTGYIQCELYMQYKRHIECTVHMQRTIKPRMGKTRSTRDCKLRCCHHPSQAGQAAFSTVPQLGLGGPVPLLAI